MEIGQILKEQQPKEYKKLNEKEHKQIKKEEHLSFSDYKMLMEDAGVYRRTKGGSYRQVK